MKGVSTVIATILMLIITIALAGMAYMYIAGVFTATVQGIEVIDAYCDRGIVTITIRNIGTNVITSFDVRQTSPPDNLASPYQGIIEPGRTINYKDVCFGDGSRSCIYRITPPLGKSATATATCIEKPQNLLTNAGFETGTWGAAGDCCCGYCSCSSPLCSFPAWWKCADPASSNPADCPIAPSCVATATGGVCNSPPCTCSASYDSTQSMDAAEGSYSLQLAGVNACACNAQGASVVTPDTNYTVGFKYKHISGGAPSYCVWVCGCNICYPSGSLTYTGGWDYFETTFQAPSCTTCLLLHLYGSLGTNLYDDVKFVKLD